MSDIIIFSDSSKYDNQMITIPIRMAGPFRMATELRQAGYSCQIIDFLFSFNQEEIIRLCSKFIRSNTQVVAFSTTFWLIDSNKNITPHILKSIDIIIKYIKKHHPTIKIVIGGSEVHQVAHFFKFDAEFVGYSDSLFLKYIKNEIVPTYVKQNGSAVYEFNQHEESFNFSESKIVYHSNDIVNQHDTVSLEVSRGCIFKCKFCAFPLNGKKKLDYIKDPDILRDELCKNYEDFKITNYIISDDTFNDSTQKLKQLHGVFSSLPFQIKFAAYLRLDLLYSNPEQIYLLKDMGLTGANFGIESFNHLSAKSIGKGMHPETIKKFLFDLKTKHWGSHVNITIGLIIGLPYETIDSISETINWINDQNYCVVDSITPKALSLKKQMKGLWASDFEKNSEKYGYVFSSGGSDWTNTKYQISNYKLAQELEYKIFQACFKNYKDSFNNNFILFILNNLIQYADTPITFQQFCSLSNKEKYEWRQKNLNLCISRYIADYKNKLFDLD